ISEHVKSCLVEKYQLSPDKIDVIYNGFGADYEIIEDPRKLESIKNRYGLTRPFLYYPAATWPHKNHKNLLMAVKLLIDRYNFDGHLVLSGANFQAHSDVMQEVKRLGLDNTVKALGYLPYDDLPALFNLARIMVYPSLFEGFGIPLVEAMACGCPVICSDRTSLPEVAGEAALLIDPTSPEDIADKIWAAWNDEGNLASLRTRGLQRAEFFSWEKMAKKTIDVYRRTVENCR
ncbi:MAG TPA: glycosyltransferase family 1 protein, partial [Geothermobacteraceae bacterium]|nr:glycosyltransferase family 1 protein [Geothermobacteraceae bacterium]